MAAFFVAAALPAAGTFWYMNAAAFSHEKANVRDKHLNIAKQLSTTADVLVRERFEVLRRFAEATDVQPTSSRFMQAMQSMGFRHLCVVDLAARKVINPTDIVEGPSINREIAFKLAGAVGDEPKVLPAMRDISDRPTLFIGVKVSEGRVALAGLTTEFVARLGESVSFGQMGHAVIVDQLGRALAHPLEEWRADLRDISSIKPVSQMMSGIEGVSEFDSPALMQRMIAGHVVSPSTGWGTMVVQPLSELRALADSFVMTMLVIVGPLTLLFVLFGGAVLSRLIGRPIELVADAARRFGAGDQRARAPTGDRWTVEETDALAIQFNTMADAVERHEQSLKDTLEQVRVADKAKTAFLANMSHELRTPLNAVIGFSEVISSEMLGPVGTARYKEYSDDITKSARYLLSLINDVLDLSLVEADRIEIDSEPVDAGDLIETAAKQIGPQAHAHALSVITRPPLKPITMDVDQRRVLQILLNLLSNSVRFTPGGGRIEIVAEERDGKARLTVRDTGIGMSREQAALALLPFNQPQAALDPAERGCGLGLTLARRLALLHGGELSIDSEVGKGCTVYVDLPLAGDATQKAAA